MSDQEKRIQEIIDDLKRENLEYDEKEAYQEEFKRNAIIIAALESLQRERKEPDERTIVLPCKASVFKDEIENKFRSECPISDTDLEEFGDCRKNCFDCFACAIAARDAATEPKGEHHD